MLFAKSPSAAAACAAEIDRLYLDFRQKARRAERLFDEIDAHGARLKSTAQQLKTCGAQLLQIRDEVVQVVARLGQAAKE